MRERAEPVLKIVCLALAVLLAWRVAGILGRVNPLRGVSVPALPTIAAKITNPTNPAQILTKTNFAAVAGTNKIVGTNLVSAQKPLPKGTNVLTTTTKTNSAASTNSERKIVLHNLPAIMGGMNFQPFAPPVSKIDLPPAMQARIRKISDSGILGPVIRPLPMALLGIAGDVAFLRAPNGQTGLVKAGDSLGEIKLLRIGINRVLVEQDGQPKELTIFSGYGGESLLPQTGDINNETHIP